MQQAIARILSSLIKYVKTRRGPMDSGKGVYNGESVNVNAGKSLIERFKMWMDNPLVIAASVLDFLYELVGIKDLIIPDGGSSNMGETFYDTIYDKYTHASREYNVKRSFEFAATEIQKYPSIVAKLFHLEYSDTVYQEEVSRLITGSAGEDNRSVLLLIGSIRDSIRQLSSSIAMDMVAGKLPIPDIGYIGKSTNNGTLVIETASPDGSSSNLLGGPAMYSPYSVGKATQNEGSSYPSTSGCFGQALGRERSHLVKDPVGYDSLSKVSTRPARPEDCDIDVSRFIRWLKNSGYSDLDIVSIVNGLKKIVVADLDVFRYVR